MVKAADPSTEYQFMAGFYPPEGNSWRWTMRAFSVMLGPPRLAEQNGARLELHLYVPETQIQNLGPMTLRANAGGYPLAAETFRAAGMYVYTREIPREALATNVLPVRFAWDKAAAATSSDSRELSAVVTSVGLETNQ